MHWWLQIKLVDAWCMASVRCRFILMLLSEIYWLLDSDFALTYSLSKYVISSYLACCSADC